AWTSGALDGGGLVFPAGRHDGVHGGALPVSRLSQPISGSAAARLRAVPVRRLLRPGAREAGPGSDLDPRSHRAVSCVAARVSEFGPHGAGKREDPCPGGSARRARVRRRVLLHAQGRAGGGSLALPSPTTA